MTFSLIWSVISSTSVYVSSGISSRSPAYSRTSDSYAPNLAATSHSCRSDIVPDSTWRQAEVVVVSREECA